MLKGRVLITGGAGFLARGIYRRAAREKWPAVFTCLSRDDAKHEKLRAWAEGHREPVIESYVRGDICGDRDWLASVFEGHDLVIHAAANKYVDASEMNAIDTVRVNIEGSLNVAWAAQRAGVRRVVGVSTDKAATPVNVYGMSKAVMERIFVEADRRSPVTRFSVVRYGNVVGSTGSVIPKFKRQLEETGEVLVTDADMTRFWMGVDEAVDVILHAVNVAPPGRTVIPTPKAMTILGVVHAACGGVDHVRIIGTRPGEKLHEQLIHEQESVRAVATFGSVLKGAFWELKPPGSTPGCLPFSVSSDNPPGGWMQPYEMMELIADAEELQR